MPKNDIFTNDEVLNSALKKAKWKSDKALQLLKTEGLVHDERNLKPLAALIIDLDNIPEEQKEAYFTEEVNKIKKAFNTIDPNTNRPYPDAVKPYIEKMYSSIPSDLSAIDWNNEKQVVDLLCTLSLDQCATTMILDFKKECLEIFSDHDTLARLDATIANVNFNFLKAESVLKSKIKNLGEYINVASSHIDRYSTQIERIVGQSVAKATLDGSNTITIDPTEHELLKDCFLKKPYSEREVFDETTNDFNDYTDTDCARSCTYELMNSYFRAPVEQMMLKETINNSETFDEKSLLLINGKSMKEISDELKQKHGKSDYQALTDTSIMLRNALTDGKSVVTLMRVGFDKDGNTFFRHQDVKVDLDKLNQAAFEERYKKAGRIRRFLHDVGIWKISKKYATNEARDKAQQKAKEKPNIKNAMLASEKSAVETYNKLSVEHKEFERKLALKPNKNREANKGKELNNVFNVIPKLSLPGEKNAVAQENVNTNELESSRQKLNETENLKLLTDTTDKTNQKENSLPSKESEPVISNGKANVI